MKQKENAFERQFGWFDLVGNYYYMNRVMIFKFAAGVEPPEEFRDTAPGVELGNETMQKMADNLLKGALEKDVEQVEALNMKQIGEQTERGGGDGSMRYVSLRNTPFDPRYLKVIRRTLRDAMWYVGSGKHNGERFIPANLYAITDDGCGALLLPMRLK